MGAGAGGSPGGDTVPAEQSTQLSAAKVGRVVLRIRPFG